MTRSELEALKELYKASVMYVDHLIGSLLKRLNEEGLRRSYYCIITSDHGDEFGEHGGIGHTSGKLYNELLHVPLVIFPYSKRGLVINTQVRLLDLAPTILDILNISSPRSFQGRSLLPVIEGKEKDGREVIAEYSGRNGIRYSLMIEDWKLILSFSHKGRTIELYNLKMDPYEKENLATTYPEVLKILKARLISHINREFRGKSLKVRLRKRLTSS